MRLILTALIIIAGLFDLLLGVGFFLDPVNSGARFFLRPNGDAGLAVLRADMTAFFVVAAVWMIWGAWKRNGDLLLVPAALFGIAFVGRLLSAVVDGTYPQFWLPMSVEAFHVALLLWARQVLPHHTLEQMSEG
jgi:hypothetical protein